MPENLKKEDMLTLTKTLMMTKKYKKFKFYLIIINKCPLLLKYCQLKSFNSSY